MTVSVAYSICQLLWPMELTSLQQLATFVPLVVLVSVAYRAAKVADEKDLWTSAARFLVGMVGGMLLIGLVLWALIGWQLP